MVTRSARCTASRGCVLSELPPLPLLVKHAVEKDPERKKFWTDRGNQYMDRMEQLAKILDGACRSMLAFRLVVAST